MVTPITPNLSPLERCLAGYHDDLLVADRAPIADEITVSCRVCGASC